MKRSALYILALVATPAAAANLSKTMSEPAKYTFQSRKPLQVIERCIVMSDMPDWPNVYRAPEQPNESLIYYAQGPAIQLEADSRGVTIRLWRPNGGGMVRNVESCAS